MSLRKGGALVLSLLFVSVLAVGGGIAGVLLLASVHPGVKGPHITDRQAVGAFVGGALLGAGLAALLVAGMKKIRN